MAERSTEAAATDRGCRGRQCRWRGPAWRRRGPVRERSQCSCRGRWARCCDRNCSSREGGVVPLQEAELVQAIRLLTRFGQVQDDPSANPEALQKELIEVDPNTRLNLQQLLGSLAAKATTKQEEDTPLLMKAAEHMAIRFALERYSKGEVKVNAVHQMMEHMSRQMDSLRGILKLQEEKMNKAGILVESHADILDRMFWAEVPESGKKTVLLSNEAPCVP